MQLRTDHQAVIWGKGNDPAVNASKSPLPEDTKRHCTKYESDPMNE